MKIINITNTWEDEDMVELSVQISNGYTSCELEFYQNDYTFLAFAEELIDFPKTVNHSVKYETGNWNNSGHYFSLEVSCVTPTGISAMKVIAKDFCDIPDAFEVQFYIQSEPANFNGFGKVLASWKPRLNKKLEWQFY